MVNIRSKYAALIIFFFAISIVMSCYKEERIFPDIFYSAEYYMRLNGQEVAFDFEKGFALFPVTEFTQDFEATVTLDDIVSLKINGQEVKNNEVFHFEPIDANAQWELDLLLETGEKYLCKLSFTRMPVAQIYNSTDIQMDEKVLAIWKLSDPNLEHPVISYAGIEHRGGGSLWFPKKNFALELWNDKDGDSKNSTQLLNMRTDDDWILDAMYRDVSNMRNRVSFKIWEEIIDEKAYEKGFIKGEYIEVFINNSYNGIYCLNEKIDALQLDLEDISPQSSVPVYKSEDWTVSTKFEDVEDTLNCHEFWSGWEQKHPDPQVQSYWKPVYTLIDFVANSTNSIFEEGIYERLSKNNIMDYFILMNLSQAIDNTGKNIILAKTSKVSPFNFYAWDLDATWGRSYNSDLLHANYKLSINLYDRLMYLNTENFSGDLKARWFELREEIITPENIDSYFSSYARLFHESGAYQREIEKWPDSMVDLDTEIEYIGEWTSERIIFLDNYFSNLD